MASRPEVALQDGRLTIVAERYRLTVDHPDRPYARLADADGRVWADLLLIGNVATLDGPDDWFELDPPTIEGATVRWPARSARWADAALVLEPADHQVRLWLEVDGAGALTDVELFAGWMSARPRMGTGRFESGAAVRGDRPGWAGRSGAGLEPGVGSRRRRRGRRQPAGARALVLHAGRARLRRRAGPRFRATRAAGRPVARDRAGRGPRHERWLHQLRVRPGRRQLRPATPLRGPHADRGTVALARGHPGARTRRGIRSDRRGHPRPTWSRPIGRGSDVPSRVVAGADVLWLGCPGRRGGRGGEPPGRAGASGPLRPMARDPGRRGHRPGNRRHRRQVAARPTAPTNPTSRSGRTSAAGSTSAMRTGSGCCCGGRRGITTACRTRRAS